MLAPAVYPADVAAGCDQAPFLTEGGATHVGTTQSVVGGVPVYPCSQEQRATVAEPDDGTAVHSVWGPHV